MNAEFFWTTVALAFAGLIVAPFYLAMFIAFDKASAGLKMTPQYRQAWNYIKKRNIS